MSRETPITHSLIDVDDCLLVVIDVQDHFLAKCDASRTTSLVRRIVWLAHVARRLGVPIVVTAEDMSNTGPPTQAITDALPEGTKIHDKDAFSLTDNREIIGAIAETKRKTAILVGLETDVCVAQSALGLIGCSYRVVALTDAVATPEFDQESGLERMRGAGVAILSVKALYYEWLRSVSRLRRVQADFPELTALRPADMTL